MGPFCPCTDAYPVCALFRHRNELVKYIIEIGPILFFFYLLCFCFVFSLGEGVWGERELRELWFGNSNPEPSYCNIPTTWQFGRIPCCLAIKHKGFCSSIRPVNSFTVLIISFLWLADKNCDLKQTKLVWIILFKELNFRNYFVSSYSYSFSFRLIKWVCLDPLASFQTAFRISALTWSLFFFRKPFHFSNVCAERLLLTLLKEHDKLKLKCELVIKKLNYIFKQHCLLTSWKLIARKANAFKEENAFSFLYSSSNWVCLKLSQTVWPKSHWHFWKCYLTVL